MCSHTTEPYTLEIIERCLIYISVLSLTNIIWHAMWLLGLIQILKAKPLDLTSSSIFSFFSTTVALHDSQFKKEKRKEKLLIYL